MIDLSHLSNGKHVVSELRDFSEDLDDTLCALCGKTPDKCPCYVHPPHSCLIDECDCGVECSCCELKVCDCTQLRGKHDGT